MVYIIKFKDGSIKKFDTLRGADLSGAYLSEANLNGADLYRADLSEANLRGADLRGANLYGADLRGANLRGADLRGANLSEADLSGAYLREAYLSEANLRGADLSEANLRGADLSFTKGIMIFQAEQHQLIYYRSKDIYRIRIGCEDHKVEHWLNNVESIGKRNGYSEDEIDIYKNIINLFSKYELV